MPQSLIIDFGGYGAPESYAKLQDELGRKAKDPAVCAIMQILALKREQANADAGSAAREGEASAAAARAAIAEGLRDALTTIPGITFGAGEGGGGYGDSINLRGQSLTSSGDVQIDGVRDTAQYSRSDTFNIEQIEVVNGANSVYGGSGSIRNSKVRWSGLGCSPCRAIPSS